MHNKRPHFHTWLVDLGLDFSGQNSLESWRLWKNLACIEKYVGCFLFMLVSLFDIILFPKHVHVGIYKLSKKVSPVFLKQSSINFRSLESLLIKNLFREENGRMRVYTLK